MPTIGLGTGENYRALGRLPHIRLRNIFPEVDKSNGVDGLARLQRPGLAPFATVGSGPINAVFRLLGAFDSNYIVVSGQTVYRVTEAGVATMLGAVSAERAQIAASATRAIIVNGGTAWSTNGTTITAVAMPDSLPVGGVAFISGYFVLSVKNSQRVYYIEPGETDPDPLSFFEAERAPDPIVTPAIVGDELWLIGAETEEVWSLTGDIDAPFSRINARAYENGCAARDSLVHFDGALAWVTSDYRVVIAQGAPQTVSTPAITEHLRATDPATFRAWFYKLDSHIFYVLTTATDTFAFDMSTQATPIRFSSGTADTWRGHLGTGMVCGDSQSGALWRLDTSRSNDVGEPMVRQITGGVEIVGGPERCNSVSMRMAVGWSPSPDFEPRIEMRYSDDEGATWSAWQARSLGKQGHYNATVAWRKLGMIYAPGRLFDWRMTDDALLRISYAQINEIFG